jgi:hypothetical protein
MVTLTDIIQTVVIIIGIGIELAYSRWRTRRVRALEARVALLEEPAQEAVHESVQEPSTA